MGSPAPQYDLDDPRFNDSVDESHLPGAPKPLYGIPEAKRGRGRPRLYVLGRPCPKCSTPLVGENARREDMPNGGVAIRCAACMARRLEELHANRKQYRPRRTMRVDTVLEIAERCGQRAFFARAIAEMERRKNGR